MLCILVAIKTELIIHTIKFVTWLHTLVLVDIFKLWKWSVQSRQYGVLLALPLLQSSPPPWHASTQTPVLDSFDSSLNLSYGFASPNPTEVYTSPTLHKYDRLFFLPHLHFTADIMQENCTRKIVQTIENFCYKFAEYTML